MKALGLSIVVLFLFVELAHSHSRFDIQQGTTPMSDRTDIKDRPGTDNDTSNPPCGDLMNSDVKQLNAGEDYTLYWVETIDHQGSWELYFSPTGPCPVMNRNFNNGNQIDCWYPMMRIQDGQNGTPMGWSYTVKVPNINCDNCVFQLRQIMGGNAANNDPGNVNDPYYSCHQVKITGANIDEGPGLAPQCKVIKQGTAQSYKVESKNNERIQSHVHGHSHHDGHH